MNQKFQKEDIKNIVELIYRYKYLDKKGLCPKDEALIANEVNSVNYMDSTYKIYTLIKHKYNNYHFSVNGIAYDIFVYDDVVIDKLNLIQLICCNNHIQIFKFDQNNYENRKQLSNFTVLDDIYSFFDSSIIIIGHKEFSKDVNYEQISIEV